ncbi:MAG: hypothetical protein H0U94_03835 [Acidobacteria bacterium]|nr:hypothetical protein [Acidobacteriota bacterium]
MKIRRNSAFAALSVASIVFALQTPATGSVPQRGARGGLHHTLRLKVNFLTFSSTNPSLSHDLTNTEVLMVGDQFTLAGSVEGIENPETGHFGVHFVSTGLAGPAANLLAHGALTLSGGTITFQMLVRPSDNPARAAITGGTRAYSNAGGELVHYSHPNGDQEFVFYFSTH